VAEDTTDKHRRARIIVSAGISPDAALSGRAKAAVDTLMARTDDDVDALLALLVLVVEARQPTQHPPVSKPPDGVDYPNPRPSVKRPGPPIW
jgi:hypothetical protein